MAENKAKRKRSTPKWFTTTEIQLIQRLVAAGVSQSEIGRVTGRHSAVIATLLKKLENNPPAYMREPTPKVPDKCPWEKALKGKRFEDIPGLKSGAPLYMPHRWSDNMPTKGIDTYSVKVG